MNSTPDLLTQALDHDLRTNTRTKIDAHHVTDPDNKHHHYYCTDCAAKGRNVRLKYTGEALRRVTFNLLDRKTGEIVLDDKSQPKEKEKKYRLPPRFERWPGAEEHACDHPVRYQAFRSFAFMLNATSIGDYQHIFPLLIPGQRWHHNEEARQGDLRRAFRPVGTGLSGISNPKAFVRLADFAKKDPGIQSFQLFHDGLSLRSFEETFFDKPVRLHDFLKMKGAVGRGQSMLVTYLMNPNTSNHALEDPETAGGFIDRDMAKAYNTPGRIKLFARAANDDMRTALFKEALRHGHFENAHILVQGEAFIHPEKPNHVEIELFHEDQICAWDSPYKFFPEQKAKGVHRAATLAQQATLSL